MNTQPSLNTRRAKRRGMTLIELLVAMVILAFISILVFSAIDGMRRSREGVDRITARYREGRLAMARISRELQAAYLSAHAPIDDSLLVVKTSFVGEPSSPAARIDFNSFSHRRLSETARESDQVEISYFGSEDPDKDGVIDLARRVARPDAEPRKGGKVEVLATDIDLFDLKYLDPLTGQWREEWDSTSVIGEKGRMPVQVKVTLVLNGAARSSSEGSRGKIRLVSKIPLMIQDPLSFALK
jgi:general secretion pathway protein J